MAKSDFAKFQKNYNSLLAQLGGNVDITSVINFCMCCQSDDIKLYKKYQRVFQDTFSEEYIPVVAEQKGLDINNPRHVEAIKKIIVRNCYNNGLRFHVHNSAELNEFLEHGIDPFRTTEETAKLIELLEKLNKDTRKYVTPFWEDVLGESGTKKHEFFYSTNLKSLMHSTYGSKPEWLDNMDRNFHGLSVEKLKDTYFENEDIETVQQLYDFYQSCVEKYSNGKKMIVAFPMIGILDDPIDLNADELPFDLLSLVVASSIDNSTSEIFLTDSLLLLNAETGVPLIERTFEQEKQTEEVDEVYYKILGISSLPSTGFMYDVEDINGRQFLFKKGMTKDGKSRDWRKDAAQIVGYHIQKMIDPESAVKVQYFNGGTLQERIDVDQDKTKMIQTFQDNEERVLDDTILQGLMREYVVDYLLCNYDSHQRNFIVDKNGILRGIDKEQSFKYIDDERSLSSTFDTNFNMRYGEKPSIYKTIFERMEQGKVSPQILDYLDQYVKNVSEISDEEFLKAVSDYTFCFYEYRDDIEDYDFAEFNRKKEQILKRKKELPEIVKSLKEKYCTREEELDLPELVGMSKGYDVQLRDEYKREVREVTKKKEDRSSGDGRH